MVQTDIAVVEKACLGLGHSVGGINYRPLRAPGTAGVQAHSQRASMVGIHDVPSGLRKLVPLFTAEFRGGGATVFGSNVPKVRHGRFVIVSQRGPVGNRLTLRSAIDRNTLIGTLSFGR